MLNPAILQAVSDHLLHIGYVGHLYKGRGIELILNMAKQRVELLFHIVGGLDEDIKYWKDIASKMTMKPKAKHTFPKSPKT